MSYLTARPTRDVISLARQEISFGPWARRALRSVSNETAKSVRWIAQVLLRSAKLSAESELKTSETKSDEGMSKLSRLRSCRAFRFTELEALR